MTLDLDPGRSASPCLEHLYWPDEAEFRVALYDALHEDANFPPLIDGAPPATETLLDCLQSSENPVQTIVPWLKRHTKPRSVPIACETSTNQPPDLPQDLTQEQIRQELEEFKAHGGNCAYELPAAGPRREGWIKVLDEEAVGLMVVNNSYTRDAREPQVQLLFWKDQAQLRDCLYRGFRNAPGCPQPVGASLPTTASLLAFLQNRETPLERFVDWARANTAPKIIVVRPSAHEKPVARDARHTSSREAGRARSLLPLRPRRLVDRLDAPVRDVIASAALVRNIDEGRETWVHFSKACARAKFDPAHKRINVDIGAATGVMTIYLDVGCDRVVDVTADPDLSVRFLPLLAEAGLLNARFAAGVQEPAQKELTKPSVGSVVSKRDVAALGPWLQANVQRQEPIAWDAQEVVMRLPPCLSS